MHGSIAPILLTLVSSHKSFHLRTCSLAFIAMSQNIADPVNKLAKLNNSDDYILWKRRVFAYRKTNAQLLGFRSQPTTPVQLESELVLEEATLQW